MLDFGKNMMQLVVWKAVMHCMAHPGSGRGQVCTSTAAQSAAAENVLLVKMCQLYLGSASYADVNWALVREGSSGGVEAGDALFG